MALAEGGGAAGPSPAELAAEAAYWENMRRQDAMEEALAVAAKAPVPERWDADEVDIDAI